jgi:polysaccharide biosynthesis protein VpsJ
MDTPVYNVNALIAAACHRLSTVGIRDIDSNGRRADKLLRFVLSGQRLDGSWPYAKDDRGQWVDGYHSGYVLETLGYFLHSSSEAQVGDAIQRGIAFFRDSLIDSDGCPKYYSNRRYPIDVQNCAQAIQTVARLLPHFDGGIDLLLRILRTVKAALFVRQDPSTGYFMASRTRWSVNKTAYVRWGQAPMVLALTHACNALRGRNTYFYSNY